jgi:hypothetical protein
LGNNFWESVGGGDFLFLPIVFSNVPK